MEQKSGKSIPPIPPAGVDPAYIPGLTPPGSMVGGVPTAAPAASPAGKTPDDPDAAEVPEAGPAAEAAADTEAESDAEPASEAGAAEEAEDASEEAEGAEDEDTGPVFTVSDRRGSITADRTGITFKLDGESADFGWDEIGAVEIDTPRFGRRFSVTVYTSSRRWFDTDVEASSKALLKTWTAELEAVLDTYFEDDEPKNEEEAGAADEVEEAEAEDTDTADEPEKAAETAKAKVAKEPEEAKATEDADA